MQPPSTPAAPDEPLYEAFYGFREQPFALTTDPRFLFMSDAHRRAYEELLTGLRRREGLMLLTGDTGMGKTTLCRAVIDALGPRTFSALILNPYMNDAEVLRVILRDFGLVTRDEIRKGASARVDVPQLLDTLEGFLRSLVPLNSYAVVIIDEAQSLASFGLTLCLPITGRVRQAASGEAEIRVQDELLCEDKHLFRRPNSLRWQPRQTGTFDRNMTFCSGKPILSWLEDENLEKWKQGIGSKQASHCGTNNNGKYATRL